MELVVVTTEYVFVLTSVIFSVILLFVLKERLWNARRNFEHKHPSLYNEYVIHLYNCVGNVYNIITWYHVCFMVMSVFVGMILPSFIAFVGIVLALVVSLYCVGIQTGVDGCVSVLEQRGMFRIYVKQLEKMIKDNEDQRRLE